MSFTSQPLCWSQDPAFRALAGPALRPGGAKLTGRAVDLLDLRPGQRVLDAGCGGGATVRRLRGEYGLAAVGVDLQPSPPGEYCVAGRMEALPFPDATFDAALCECSLSLTDREAALAELGRVLKPGGGLAVADLYGDSTDLDELAVLMATAGFRLFHAEDHTRELAELAARMVLAGLDPRAGDRECGRTRYGLFAARRSLP